MGDDPKQEWIRQTNRSRKMKDEWREKQAKADEAMATREKAAREQLELAETTAQSIRYLSEMWGAGNGKDASGNRVIDFDQVDEAFRQNMGGMTIDEYNRARARRGVANPEATRLKAENRRLELELERSKGNGAATPAGRSEAAPAAGASGNPPEGRNLETAPAAPAAVSPGLHENPEEFWGDELPADHPLRQFSGWPKLLDNAMLQWHDDVLDEYSRDAEEVATELVKRKLEALGAGDDEEKVPVRPHARAKPKTPKNRGARQVSDEAPATDVKGIGFSARELTPRGAVNSDRSHRPTRPEELQSDGGMAARTRWATERAMLRLRGIDPDAEPGE